MIDHHDKEEFGKLLLRLGLGMQLEYDRSSWNESAMD